MANGGMPDLGSIMDVLKNNPSAVSSILGILQTAGVSTEKPTEAEYTEKDSKAEDREKEDAAVGATPKEERHDGEKERHSLPMKQGEERDAERLLLALRPFLSPEKCKRLDELHRYMGLIRIFQSQGGKR